MGWLSDLLGRAPFHELDVPPIRIHPLTHLQIIDLRAVQDALGVGLRVAIEMVRTIAAPRARAFIFSSATTRELLALDATAIKRVATAMRAHLPRPRRASEDVIERSTGEVVVLVPPEMLAPAKESLAVADIGAVPDSGPGSGNVLDVLGQPTSEKHYTIVLPRFAPDLCAVEGVPGIGMRWHGHLLLDLRRLATGEEYSLATCFVAASFAITELSPFAKRTWIIAPWMLGTSPAVALENATLHARAAIALHRPEQDRVVFDGTPSDELVAWVRDLGLAITERPYPLSSELSLPYPQLAQNLMLDYAVRGR